MKKVAIIGAGVSGLTAGIYAAKSGFDVSVYEQHFVSGGTCTSWKRKGYTFEGAVHWLTGSKKGLPLNKLWMQTGALSDDIKLFRNDPYLVYETNGKKICLFRDLEKLRLHFLEIAPEDKKNIQILYSDIKKMMAIKVPVLNVPGVRVNDKSGFKLFDILNLIPSMPAYMRLKKISMEEYVSKFKNIELKTLLSNIVTNEFSALSGVMTLATFINDGGFPEGGSKDMIERMENKLKYLGGKIHLKSKVDKILVDDKKVTGLVVNGEKVYADHVIVTKDILSSMSLFDKSVSEKWIEKLKKDSSQICTFVSLGIKADLSHMPHGILISLNEPLDIAGIKYKALKLNNYACYNEDFAPKGCSSVTINCTGDSYDFWRQKKENGEYEDAKEEVSKKIIKAIEEKFPEICGKIEVVDVATPLTYERYTGSYKGSWMVKLAKKSKMNMKLGKSNKVSNLYFAGFRLTKPGGFPIALMTGRRCVQMLCRDVNYVFEDKERNLSKKNLYAKILDAVVYVISLARRLIKI